MKKKNLILVAMATAILATSCAEEQQFGGAISNSAIALHPTIGKVGTRATETTTANLHAFRAYSFLTDDNVNYMDGVTYSNSSGGWNTSAGSFYWPVKGELNFYCYAPETPGKTGTFAIDPSSQKLTGFAPFPTAAAQQDLVYAKATGSLAANATSGLDVNFSHALSEITIAAKNTNAAYTVEVSGVKLGNVISEGDFTFPSVAGADASWSIGDERSDYTTEWQNATTLSSTVSSLDASNTAFMLIPQQLAAQAKAVDGNYIALKVKIIMQGGQVVHDGWAYVAIPTLWEMNKHYAYTLDFSEGAGQDENGNDIISGSGIKFNVTVTPWDEEGRFMPNIISGKNVDSAPFSVQINETAVPVVMNGDGTWRLDLNDRKISSLRNLFYDYGGNTSKVQYLNVNGLNTSEVTNMMTAFYKCGYLKFIDLSKWDTHNVTEMSGMFQTCNSLTSLDLSNFNTSNVTNMRYMFNKCSSLTSLDVSKFDTRNVTNMRTMFQNCNSLTSLDVSSFNTEKVTDMAYMFTGCTSLKTLDVSNFNTLCVSNMQSMFNKDSLLTKLDISQFDTHNVTNISYMFNGCVRLNGLNIANFDVKNVINMEAVFQDCNSLTELDVSKWNTSKVTNMGWMFKGCKKLRILDVSNFNTEKVTNMATMFGGCTSLKTLDVSKWNTSNVTNMATMFQSCSSLTSLDVSNFNTEKVTNMSWMFYECSSLTSLDVSNFNTEKVMNMQQMFDKCESLTSLDVSKFNTQNVTNMKWMFARCSSLTSLDVSNFNTSNVTDMYGMFRINDCLRTLDLSGWNMTKVTDSNYMFAGCNNLQTVYMIGCNETTINKVKQALTQAGLSTDIVKTAR